MTQIWTACLFMTRSAQVTYSESCESIWVRLFPHFSANIDPYTSPSAQKTQFECQNHKISFLFTLIYSFTSTTNWNALRTEHVRLFTLALNLAVCLFVCYVSYISWWWLYHSVKKMSFHHMHTDCIQKVVTWKLCASVVKRSLGF